MRRGSREAMRGIRKEEKNNVEKKDLMTKFQGFK